MAKEATAEKPAENKSEEITRVYFTDAQRVASQQAEIQHLRQRIADESASHKAQDEARSLTERNLTASLREAQAKLLAAQDRVVELQGRLLSLRSIANAPVE